MTKDQLNIDQLAALITEKKVRPDKKSYTSLLIEGGDEAICRKVGEEAVEVVIAAFVDTKKSSKKTKSDLVGEVCDLFYHSLVLLSAHDIELSEIYAEFSRRNSVKTDKKIKKKWVLQHSHNQH